MVDMNRHARCRFRHVTVDYNKLLQKFVYSPVMRHKLRGDAVLDIVKYLEGTSGRIENPFAVNLRDGKFRILDGYHCFEALKIFLSKDAERKVKIPLAVFKGLDDHEELVVYKRWEVS